MDRSRGNITMNKDGGAYRLDNYDQITNQQVTYVTSSTSVTVLPIITRNTTTHHTRVNKAPDTG